MHNTVKHNFSLRSMMTDMLFSELAYHMVAAGGQVFAGNMLATTQAQDHCKTPLSKLTELL